MLKKIYLNILNQIRVCNEKKFLRKLKNNLTNSDITIVCNNCIGGVMYHNLGLKFLSPTINLSIHGEEYLEFVKNFKYYISCDVFEAEMETNYPIGIIKPDNDKYIPIHLHFQHYKSFEQAKYKWNERKSRINWDNILFIWEFYDLSYDNSMIYEFDKLPINKMIITHRYFENLDNQYRVSCYVDDKPVSKILSYDGITGKRFLDEVDYLTVINNIKK